MKNTSLLRIIAVFGILNGILSCGVKAPVNQAAEAKPAPNVGPSSPLQVEVLGANPRANLYLHGNNAYGSISSPTAEAVVSWEYVTNPNDHEVTFYAQPDSAFDFSAVFRTNVSTDLGFNIPPLEEAVYGLYRPKWALTKVKVRDEANQGSDVKLVDGILTLTLKPGRSVRLGWVAGVVGTEKICTASRSLLVTSQYSRHEFVKIVGQSLGYLIQREYRQDDGQGGQAVIFQSTTQSRVTEGELGQNPAENVVRLNGSPEQVQACDRIELK